MEELKGLIKNLENQLINLATRENKNTDKSDKKSNEVNDKILKAKKESEETSASLEEALCDIDTVASDRLADLEEALCELSEIMEEGGNDNG